MAASETVFADRRDAGRRLGAALGERGLTGGDRLVLGIPRGGVVVADEVARETSLPLRAVLARKLGAPTQPELAIGALGPDGEPFLDDDLVRRLGVDPAWLQREIESERRVLGERIALFPGVVGAGEVGGRTAIVVDDGVATGATAAAVGLWLGHAGAARSVLALPVGPPTTLDRLADAYDDVVALARPRFFMAVGQWYRDFTQTTDAEVVELLSASR